MKHLKSIDLFAGIGGIRLGFEQAFGDEISTVYVSEWDKNAQKTYAANFSDEFDIAGDITEISENDIPEFDICLAGFPCQAFSLAGQRKGFSDNFKGMARGTLFFDVARICAEHKPKVIFCENVKGLTIHDKGRTFDIIKGTLTELGYTVHEQILNSKDYGVPQNRERIYIVAFRNDIDSSGFSFPAPTDDTKRIRDIIQEAPIPTKYYLSDVYVETLRRHRARHEAKGHGFGYEIRSWDEIAGAIVCGGMGRERNLLIDNREHDKTPTTSIKGIVNLEGIRKMTPREWARLQGYPDTFILPLADTHLYKQLGNSVSVPVIAAIAAEIKRILDCAEEKEMVQIKGNKGEWSEIYAFLRLLATGKIYAADEHLNRIENMFFPIIKIIREEVHNTPYEYFTGNTVRICLGEKTILELPATEFSSEADHVFEEIVNQGTRKGAFSIEDTETFMRKIHVNKLKAPSNDKSDINMQTQDVNTGYEQVVGFSIKSELGSSPTLLNAGKTTNFIYRIEGLPKDLITEINEISTPTKILDRISAIKSNGGEFKFFNPENATFSDNIVMIDSQMDIILSEMLVAYYSGIAKNCTDLLKYVEEIDPLNRNPKFYEHKVKDLLCAVALGMKPATPWDGSDEASGGYIIVKTDGDVLAYHLYNRDSFKAYLLNNTRFESAGTTRHEYAVLYEEGGKIYIRLNLQIRFI